MLPIGAVRRGGQCGTIPARGAAIYRRSRFPYAAVRSSHSNMGGADMAAMCEAQTLCFELAKGVPAAVVALLVGVVGAFIAWRQYHVARAKLNLDLFEKRYELFNMVWAFASFVVQDGPPSLQAPERIELKNLNPKIEFLFGDEIAK
ncbi:hypothetical protein LL998_01015 [Burkholderia ambifaria]|uniref:hypothetical protein n=1 Tax=Burkholderia ambifaria TaxID=152480 RepID=UPI001E52922D|nr:hypothetical protein [Burkholderia ambifaria]UEP34910.1 hypothetical protein LL998_01015 [Burkholderia ambifaria]